MCCYGPMSPTFKVSRLTQIHIVSVSKCSKLIISNILSREMGHSVTDLHDCNFQFILLTWFCFACFLLSHQKLLIQFYPVSLCQILSVFETEGSSFFQDPSSLQDETTSRVSTDGKCTVSHSLSSTLDDQQDHSDWLFTNYANYGTHYCLLSYLVFFFIELDSNGRQQ